MTTTIRQPGIYDISDDDYHADPCPEPSLSSTIAKTILAHSPLHAWMKHPRLNPHHESENKAVFDLGQAGHKLLLGEGKDIVRIEADSWRTKDAKDARDEAYAANKTPMLAHDHDRTIEMVESCKRQIQHHEDAQYFLQDTCHVEQTAVWQRDGIWCRSKCDKITASRKIIYDYKTTTDANPDTWMRQVVNMGYDVQAAHYIDGEMAINGHEPHFIFIVQEKTPPYAVCVQALTPAFLQIGRMKIERARQIWRWCLEHDKWPAFPSRTCYIDPPVFELRKWTDENGDHLNSNFDELKSMFKTWSEMQQPILEKK